MTYEHIERAIAEINADRQRQDDEATRARRSLIALMERGLYVNCTTLMALPDDSIASLTGELVALARAVAQMQEVLARVRGDWGNVHSN